MSDAPAVLPVIDVGLSIGDDGERAPTAVVDASEHPDVADLARVHAVEGIGDIRTTAQRIRLSGTDLLLLGIVLTSPVRASFALAFDLRTTEPFLDEVAGAGRLIVATTDPHAAADERPMWLAVDIDGDALRAAVATVG